MPNSFYYLVIRGTVRPGQLLTGYDADQYPEVITADPRHLEPSELDESMPADVILGELPSHADNANSTTGCEIARLSPQGPVAAIDFRAGDFECKAGWQVAAIEPIDGLLGPSAGQIIAAMQIAERVLVDEQEGPQYDAYIAAANARLRTAFDDPDEDAAAAALKQYGADSYWWSRCGSCAYGPEFTALAARDLIGTVPGWTQEAYDRLTAPWIRAFGEPIHPDDRPHIVSVPPSVALIRFARGLKRRATEIALAFSPYH